MYPQVSKLSGMDAGSEMPGELHWEVGYFGKPQFRPALRTDGKNKELPPELKDKAELQDEKGVTNTEQDDAVQHTPPDPLWPSGVCSIVIHQIVNLQLENIKGSEGNRKGREYEPAKPAGEITDEEGESLPTSYCTIHYNDELVRTSALNSSDDANTTRFTVPAPKLLAVNRFSMPVQNVSCVTGVVESSASRSVISAIESTIPSWVSSLLDFPTYLRRVLK